MSEIAISVEKLSKMYRIGVEEGRPKGLGRAVRKAAASPFAYLRRMRRQATEEETLWALRDVSFEVKRGEVVGIIGRNGAGKSTLLKILSRITEPTSGRALMHGRVGSLLEVGTGFHPELTGRENIYLSGTILGMRRAEIDRKFDEIVDFSGVERFIDTPVKRYSSGMNVRLGFAVAAHLEPEILLVDEVLAVGDAAFQKKCIGKMDSVAKEGHTVLFISHNLPAVGSLCTRAILLQQGQLVLDRDAHDVIHNYMSKNSEASLKPQVELPEDSHFPARVKRISVFCNNANNATLVMGDELRFEIEFKSSVPVCKPSIGYKISSIRGESILNGNNIFLASEALLTPVSEGVIDCSLGVVPLMEDRYTVSFWLGVDETSKHQYLENVITFDVVGADVWGQGKVPARGLSSLWWPTKFIFRSSVEAQNQRVSMHVDARDVKPHKGSI